MKLKYNFMVCIVASVNFLNMDGSEKIMMNKEQKEFDISPTEDLMREHGILNRLLLIYEELIKRTENPSEFPLAHLEQAVSLIKSFIEDYHEKLEEDYIFSLFEKHKKELKLVKTLKNQHIKGREVTAQLQKLIKKSNSLSVQDALMIKKLLKKFIVMYRPHEAREDTVLFPQVRQLLSEQELDKLGEMFEKTEHELFGEQGFEGIVAQVKIIEQALGIYELDQFTPKL